MSKSLEELKNEYVESCDNESGSFLQRDLENIRRKAWDAAIKAVSERENKLADAISVIRGIVIQIDKANGNGLYQRYSKGPINMAKKSAKEFLESTNEEALKEHGG